MRSFTLNNLFDFCAPEPTSGCWLWIDRSVAKAGYGQIWHEGEKWLAHRLAFTLMKGPIPCGLDIDHLCRVRCCINPAHLEPVTRQINLIRGIGPMLSRARRLAITHCPSGHAYSPGNTRFRKDGSRYCVSCHREQSNRAGKKLRAKLRLKRVESLSQAMTA